MLGPATHTRVELGLNIKSLPANERLVEQAAGGMCNYKIKLTDVSEVNAELVKWVSAALDAAGQHSQHSLRLFSALTHT